MWPVQNNLNETQFYLQSDTFPVDQAQWRLGLCQYTENAQSHLKLDLTMINSAYDQTKANDYFKKKEFALASNLD